MRNDTARGSGGGPPQERTLDQIWPKYLNGGYFDTNGHLRLEFVLRLKMDELAKEMATAHPALTTNQLRRFFSHCRALESAIRSRAATWEEKQAEFALLDVAAADAFGKEQKKIPKVFHDFIKRNVAVVRTEKDFLEGFLKHFEALVGFGTAYFSNERR